MVSGRARPGDSCSVWSGSPSFKGQDSARAGPSHCRAPVCVLCRILVMRGCHGCRDLTVHTRAEAGRGGAPWSSHLEVGRAGALAPVRWGPYRPGHLCGEAAHCSRSQAHLQSWGRPQAGQGGRSVNARPPGAHAAAACLPRCLDSEDWRGLLGSCHTP